MKDIPQEQSSVVGKGNLPVKKLSKEDMGWFQHHTSHSTKQIGGELWIIIETFFCDQSKLDHLKMLYHLKRRCMGSSTRTTQGGESIDSELISYTFHTKSNLGTSWKVVEMIRLLLQRICKVVASRIRNSSLSGSYIQVVLQNICASLSWPLRTLDLDGNGYLDFKENMLAMDLVNAKTPVDKLKWAFRMWVAELAFKKKFQQFQLWFRQKWCHW